MGRVAYTSKTLAQMTGNWLSQGSNSMQAEKQQAANDGPATPFTVRNKDAPAVLPWRQLAFDPDDESLPVVTERFVGSDEVVMLEVEVETIEEMLDDAPLSSALPHLEGHVENEYDEDDFDTLPETGHDDDDDDEVEDTAATLRFRSRLREAVEEQYDEPAHGNGGYYDAWSGEASEADTTHHPRQGDSTPARRAQTLHVNIGDDLSGTRSRSSLDFSPSSAVFHQHTLPFSLPAAPIRRVSGQSNPARDSAETPRNSSSSGFMF